MPGDEALLRVRDLRGMRCGRWSQWIRNRKLDHRGPGSTLGRQLNVEIDCRPLQRRCDLLEVLSSFVGVPATKHQLIATGLIQTFDEVNLPIRVRLPYDDLASVAERWSPR